MTKKPGMAKVKMETKNAGATILEHATDESVQVPGAATYGGSGPWCEVGLDASYTHNAGNYQSVKVGVSLRLPCLPGEINEMFDYAKAWVDKRMNTLVEELQDDSGTQDA
jgi:hypothetical protein